MIDSIEHKKQSFQLTDQTQIPDKRGAGIRKMETLRTENLLAKLDTSARHKKSGTDCELIPGHGGGCS